LAQNSAAMSIDTNPFAALTLVAAPAVLTNASSVLILSTSNRFARAIDRARVLAAELERMDPAAPMATLKMGQLARLERRSLLLLMGMRLFYLAMGCFASATLASVAGTVAAGRAALAVGPIELVTAVVGTVGVASLVIGSACLVRDTRLAVLNISEEAAHLRARWRKEAPADKVTP
jgi:hypothetical protein